jgi:hypothetical protein
VSSSGSAVDYLAGSLGPPEGPGAGIPGLDPVFKCGGELVEGAEDAAVQAAPLQLGEPPFDLADREGICGREVELDARVGEQPPVDHRSLVGGEVVADDVDGQARLGRSRPGSRGSRSPVLRGQLADHLAGGGVQRGE